MVLVPVPVRVARGERREPGRGRRDARSEMLEIAFPVGKPAGGLAAYLHPFLHRTCTVPAPYLHRTCTVPAPYPAQYLHRTSTVPAPYLHRTCTVPAPYLDRTSIPVLDLVPVPVLVLVPWITRWLAGQFWFRLPIPNPVPVPVPVPGPASGSRSSSCSGCLLAG